MKGPFRAVKISEHVYWVGAIDWAVRDFHGYETGRGTTYNAYLVMADKVTLIDTVKKPFKEELLERIRSVVEPEKIDYVVSNHAEMDHSGCLPEIIGIVKPEKVFASAMGVKALADHFHMDREIVAEKTGDTLSLGNMNLAFAETKMLHWPDSMVSYLDADKLLFSQDGFGMHLATSERFADELDESVLRIEAGRYYANILMPFSDLVTKLIESLPGLGLDIEIMAPDHGPIYRRKEDIERIIGWWAAWAKQEPRRKAVVVYDTMWGSTDKMARAITDGLSEAGVEVKQMRLRASHRSDVAHEILDAGALLVGSPTINNNIFPTVADVLTYLKGLKPRNLAAAAFGSFGWSGEAVKHINATLEEMKLDLCSDGLRAKYVPDADALEECRALGIEIAEKLPSKK